MICGSRPFRWTPKPPAWTWTFSLGEHWTEDGEVAGIGGTVEFRTDVYDASTVEGLVERLQRVLTAVTADPRRTLSTVDLLDEHERVRLDEIGNRSVLTHFAAHSTPVPSLPELFGAQVGRTPDAVALTCEGRSLTYAELDATSTLLAHVLTTRGAGPGQTVALLFSRSTEAIVAILAVLKTGAAYLPIDPALPQARIGFVLADAAPVAAVTSADLAGRLDGHDVAVIDVDDLVAESHSGAALSTPRQDDIAYLIYTSGTTGVPKAVAVTHRNVTQLILSTSGLPDAGVWSQWHSLAFDVSVWEIFGALLHGGRLVVVPESVARSPEELHALLVREEVTVLSETPSAAGALSLTGLDAVTLVVAGEACPVELVDRWTPARVMINAYGPTEATVYAAISAPLVPGSAVVPIGSPVPGAALFVLDGWLRPVPVGVIGELYVAGEGSRRGVRAPGWADRGAIRGLPVRRTRGPNVPHRGPGALARRRPAGLPRQGRRPGQDPRVPHRTRRRASGVGHGGRRYSGSRDRAGGTSPATSASSGTSPARPTRRGSARRWPSGCPPT